MDWQRHQLVRQRTANLTTLYKREAYVPQPARTHIHNTHTYDNEHDQTPQRCSAFSRVAQFDCSLIK